MLMLRSLSGPCLPAGGAAVTRPESATRSGALFEVGTPSRRQRASRLVVLDPVSSATSYDSTLKSEDQAELLKRRPSSKLRLPSLGFPRPKAVELGQLCRCELDQPLVTRTRSDSVTCDASRKARRQFTDLARPRLDRRRFSSEGSDRLSTPPSDSHLKPVKASRTLSNQDLPTPSSISESSIASTMVSRQASRTPPAQELPPLGDTVMPIGPDWRKGAQIGQGSYGSVFKALDPASGRIFAVKQSTHIDGNTDSKGYFDKLKGELDICRSLTHKHIVSYLGHNELSGRLFVFLEYVAGGSLASVIREFGPLNGQSLQRASRGALEGLCYLHTQRPPIVHRDVKCANILVDLDFCVKLADFGCSKRDSQTRSWTTIGSIPWMAPEVIATEDGHGRKADIWSFGCTVLEMATAETPWGSTAFDNVINALRLIGMSDQVPSIPSSVPEHAQNLISRCIQRAAEARPSARQLLMHPHISP